MERRIVWIVLLLLVSFLFHHSVAQECLDGCAAGLSACDNIDYNLYITNTSTNINDTEAALQKLFYQAKSGYLGLTCKNAIETLMCNVLHPSCDGSTATPIAPCINLCFDFLAACGDFLQVFPPIMQPWLNCTGVNPDTNQPLYSSSGSCSYSKSKTKECPNNPTPHVLPYTGVCVPYVPQLTAWDQAEVCAPYVNKLIWANNDWPNWQYVMGLSNYNYFLVQSAKPIMPQGCYQRLIQFECSMVSFSPCIEVFVPEYNTTVGTYPIPCMSMCTDINDHCTKFFDDTELSYFKFNCTGDNSYASVPTYRFDITKDFYYEGQCFTSLFPPDPVAPYEFIDVETCPQGTGKKTERAEHLPLCGLKCPDESYSDKEWDRLVVITQIGSSLSLITMIFLIVSYLLQFERRKFPASMHIWEFIATAGFAIAFLIGGRNPQQQTWCYDEGTNATQENSSRCGAQGFFFIFFGLALSLWCCNIAYSMFYGIVLNKKVGAIKKYYPVFHVLGWGIPLIFAIAAIASKSIGYGPPLAWCFIHFAGFGFGGSGTSRDYPLFYIPEGILFFIILALFTATVAKIIRIQSTTQFAGANNKEHKRHSRTFKAQIRLLIFIFIVGVICFSIFEWRLQIDGDDKNSATGIKWTYCKIKEILKLPNLHPCEGDVNPSRINYTHTAFESFLLSGIGLLIFIGFGSDPLLYKHWVKLVKLIIRRDFKALKDFVVSGIDPFPSTGSNIGPSNTGSNSKNSKNNSRNNSRNNSAVSVQGVSLSKDSGSGSMQRSAEGDSEEQ